MINRTDNESFKALFLEEVDDFDRFEDYINFFAKPIAEIMSHLFLEALEEEKHCNDYLFSPLNDFFANAGKCSRSLSCILSNFAFGGNISDCMSCAVAIETFQNAALIHDDIADDALTRRGSACVHVKNGLGIALNAGDYALSLVDSLILKDESLDSNAKLKVLNELSDMKLKTIKGQALDIGWARDHKFDLQLSDYEEMATLKTAHYTFATPLVIGASVAGADDGKLELLRRFGIKCGLAFQIKDDITNIDQGLADVTKDFALDLRSGKRTLIAIHAINNLNSKDRNRLIEILDSNENTEEEIDEALMLINSSKSLDFAKSRCKKLANEALSVISSISEENRAFKLLKSIPEWCL